MSVKGQFMRRKSALTPRYRSGLGMIDKDLGIATVGTYSVTTVDFEWQVYDGDTKPEN